MYSQINEDNKCNKIKHYINNISRILVYLSIYANLILLIILLVNLNVINNNVDNKIDEFSELTNKFNILYDHYNNSNTTLMLKKTEIILETLCKSIEECDKLNENSLI